MTVAQQESDFAFADRWRAMTEADRAALPAHERAEGFARYRKLSPAFSSDRAAKSLEHGRDFLDAERGEKRKDVRQADALVDLALEIFQIHASDTGEAFAVRRDRPGVALMFKGSRDALRATMAREYRQRHGKTPNATALADAITALEGEAQDADLQTVHLRVADHHDGLVLDLGRADGKVVMVRPRSWAVLDQSPVIFRRTALTGELPIPERGGDIESLRLVLNVTESTFPLVLAWIVTSYMPEIAHPVLMFGGEQGSGKTTSASYITSLVDPSPAQIRSQPRDPESWAMAASGSWCVLVDNVSGISGWWSDCLCKAVTGDGWVRRQLYTDSALSVLSFRRVVALTSIDAGALRGDLGDRILLVDLDPIPPARRKSEMDLAITFGMAKPTILGAVLDLLTEVLAVLPTIRLTEMPRMADFARVLAALDQIRGTNSLRSYLHQGDRVVREVLEGDPVAGAVTTLENWTGTATALLQRITPEGRVPHSWPGDPRALVARLKRLIPALRKTGVEVTLHRTSGGRVIQIEKRPETSSLPSLASFSEGKFDDDGMTQNRQSDDRPSPSSPTPHRGNDADDADDAEFPPSTLSEDGEGVAI